MLKFIKKLFKTEPEKPEPVDIKLEDLKEWFKKNSNNRYQELDNEISNINEKIDSLKKESKQKLESLKTEELKNPNIPFRAKNMMQGNRESYIRITEHFFDSITTEKDYDKILDFFKEFKDLLERYGKSTTKSYHILKEFFANIVTDIAINIKKVEEHIDEKKNSIEKSQIKNIEDIKRDIDNIKYKIKLRSELKEKIKEKDEKLKRFSETVKDEEGSITKLKDSDEYKEIKSLKEEKNSINNKIDKLKDPIFQSFSVLNKALKKYSRIAFEEKSLLEDYLDNPISTLIKDKELKIIKVLSSLKNSLDSLKLDDKKKNKTLSEIDKLNKEYLKDFIKNYEELEDKLKSIDEDIKNNKIKEKIDEKTEQLSLSKGNLERKTAELENMRKDFEKIDLENLKKETQKKINEILKTDITIV